MLEWKGICETDRESDRERGKQTYGSYLELKHYESSIRERGGVIPMVTAHTNFVIPILKQLAYTSLSHERYNERYNEGCCL